jgi:hypothetical protein
MSPTRLDFLGRLVNPRGCATNAVRDVAEFLGYGRDERDWTDSQEEHITAVIFTGLLKHDHPRARR